MNEIKFDGDKLFKIRKEKGFSQEKLALAIGVSRQTIYLWESNQSLPDVEKVGRICKVLEINLSDIVDGVDIPKVIVTNLDNNKNENVKEKNFNSKARKILIKIIFILLSFVFFIYLTISTIKFIKLNYVLNKWDDLDKNNSYYIKVKEYLTSKNENDFESIYYEKYYQDGILKMVWRDDNENIKVITIYDYNNYYKYIINQDAKNYRKEKIDEKDKSPKITYEFREKMRFSNNLVLNYIFCLNPNFNIYHNDVYELKLNNRIREIVDDKTGFVKAEETLDSKESKIERYYEVELNTDKTFEINLDEYTEVTQ